MHILTGSHQIPSHPHPHSYAPNMEVVKATLLKTISLAIEASFSKKVIFFIGSVPVACDPALKDIINRSFVTSLRDLSLKNR